jgi:uncharacterized protein
LNWNFILNFYSKEEMIEIGKMNTLTVVRETSVGIFLAASNREEAFLPASHNKLSYKLADKANVFIYTDSDGKPLASNQKPYAEVGQFAYLRAVEITSVGAFLDWGLEKDLFLPLNEQKLDVEQDNFYIVYIYIDKVSGRIVASEKLEKFFVTDKIELEVAQEVDLLVHEHSPLGYSCIINHTYKGLIYHNDIFKEIEIGDELKGYVRNIREDNLIDISFQKSGFKNVLDSTEQVLEYIKINNGFTPLNDKTSPEEISIKLSMSKATFKKAIGILYRHKKVIIKPEGVYLVPENENITLDLE